MHDHTIPVPDGYRIALVFDPAKQKAGDPWPFNKVVEQAPDPNSCYPFLGSFYPKSDTE
jgi:hypothetical protein